MLMNVTSDILTSYRQKMKRFVKAKDCYGPVLERVRNNNAIKAQHENENADPPPPGGTHLYHTRINNFIIALITKI